MLRVAQAALCTCRHLAEPLSGNCAQYSGYVAGFDGPGFVFGLSLHTAVPSRFGKVFGEEFATCQGIARQTGILLDPIYTLAGWEVAERKAVQAFQESKGSKARENRKVVYLHTGGTLGLFGLAQRYPSAIQ